MIKLEQLPEYTDSVLYDLTADQALKHKILTAAADFSAPKEKSRIFLTVPVLCSLIAVLLIAVVFLNNFKPVNISDQGEITVFAAGANHTEAPDTSYSFADILNDTEEKKVLQFQLDDGTVISKTDSCTSLFHVLKSKSIPVDDQKLSESSIITIIFDDASSVQLEAFPPLLTDGKNVWSCQEFFDTLYHFKNIQ